MKFLIWGVVVGLVILWLLRPKALRSPGANSPPAKGAPEAMLQCAECHTYFPASEALTAADGATYCCDQHRRRHAAR
jgi:uncharacterized protein